MTKNALQQEQKGKFKVVAFSDDNANRWGKQLQDIRIYPPSVILNKAWFKEQKISQLIIAIQAISPERKREITELIIKAGVDVRIVPPYRKWIEGNISVNQLKPIRIEDLLQRNKIELDSLNISDSVRARLFWLWGSRFNWKRNSPTTELLFT